MTVWLSLLAGFWVGVVVGVPTLVTLLYFIGKGIQAVTG